MAKLSSSALGPLPTVHQVIMIIMIKIIIIIVVMIVVPIIMYKGVRLLLWPPLSLSFKRSLPRPPSNLQGELISKVKVKVKVPRSPSNLQGEMISV